MAVADGGMADVADVADIGRWRNGGMAEWRNGGCGRCGLRSS